MLSARSGGELGVVVLRYFNACGADGACGEDHHPESHLVPLAVRAARDGTELKVFGDDYDTPDGTCVRDYVHVADLAAAHIAALDLLPAAAGAYNLGTGRGDSVLQVLDAVRRAGGLPLRWRVAPRRPGDPARLVASNELALAKLGWRPQRTLDDAVADAWAWTCENPAGYAERRSLGAQRGFRERRAQAPRNAPCRARRASVPGRRTSRRRARPSSVPGH